MTNLRSFEYKNRTLALAAYDAPVKPARKPNSRRAPGAGKFEIMHLDLSRSGAALTLKAEISGKNIAYLFAEILIKDGKQCYGPVLREYIHADHEKETGGVKHPDWEESASLSIRLLPGLPLLTDGTASAFAFAHPEGYGLAGSWLDGQYTSAGKQTRARITFAGDNRISGFMAFKEQRLKSTPRVLAPKPGDTFAPFVQVLTPPAEESGKWETAIVLSTPLTFSEQPLRMEKETLMPGEYLVGIVIQDLDGGFTRRYLPFTVEA